MHLKKCLKCLEKVSDLTGRSVDDACTALHDCNGDANQAVDLLFEKDNCQVCICASFIRAINKNIIDVFVDLK